MFYAEAEGLLPTRAGKINKSIQDIKDFPGSTIDIKDVQKIFRKNGLNFNDLTPREVKYVNAAIR